MSSLVPAATDGSCEWLPRVDPPRFPGMRISLEISTAQQSQLVELANRLNVTAEALAAAALSDLLERRDAEFEAAAKHVMEKNAELYRRLA